jgi:hypothetical protein
MQENEGGTGPQLDVANRYPAESTCSIGVEGDPGERVKLLGLGCSHRFDVRDHDQPGQRCRHADRIPSSLLTAP